MYVVAQDKHGKIVRMPASQVVVYDDFDQPLILAVRIMDRTVVVSHRLDSDFGETLKNLGIDRTVAVDFVDPSRMPQSV